MVTAVAKGVGLSATVDGDMGGTVDEDMMVGNIDTFTFWWCGFHLGWMPHGPPSSSQDFCTLSANKPNGKTILDPPPGPISFFHHPAFLGCCSM